MSDDQQQTLPPVWCIVANIVHQRPYGSGGQEKRHGTRHFAPGAKVYIMSFYWGMGGAVKKLLPAEGRGDASRRRHDARNTNLPVRAAQHDNAVDWAGIRNLVIAPDMSSGDRP